MFKILGPLEVIRANGDRIELSPELRAVLAMLILRPRQVVQVETFIDALWPSVEDRIARRRLHTSIWKLRKSLGTGRMGEHSSIKWSSPGYVLDVRDEQLDWVRFRRLRLAGEEALRKDEPRLAKTYLSAALSFWVGVDALSNVNVPARDLGFVAERNAGRERAAWALVEACFQAGEHDRVIPELEARVTIEPFDDDAVAHLAIAHYRSGNPQRALAICRRYLDLWADDDSARPAPLVTDLYTSILRREVEIEAPSFRTHSTSAPEPFVGQGAFMSVSWSGFIPSFTDPIPAELVLLIAEHGGHVLESNDSSVEASFAGLGRAIESAVALHRSIGFPSPARIGIEIPRSKKVDGTFDGPLRAHARLLAISARDGQVLISAGEDDAVMKTPVPGTTIRSLGRHRLNALSQPTPVFQLAGPELPLNDEAPLWFDRGRSIGPSDDAFPLVGRDREVVKISNRLGETRLVTLVGAPGSGKTKLAGHIADGLAGEYRDGVWYVALQPLSQPGMVAPTIVEILRLPRPAALHREALFRALRDREALLVLDNCEHLLDECRELVDGLLDACPQMSVLATSRESLGSRFETTVSIQPLDPPPLGSRDVLLANPAVRLLRDRLTIDAAAPSSASKSFENVEAIARICRSVDGIPLALVLAAARAQELGVDRLADVLEENLGEGGGLTVLSGTVGNGGVRTSLDATMEWSYELLDDRERELFECLAVFRAGFAPEDVVAVCSGSGLCSEADVEAGLERLVRASLVSKKGASGRYRLLQPIRDFASHKLTARSRQEAKVRRRHAHHFLSMAEAAEPHLKGRQDRAILNHLDECLPDLYAAIRWAIEHKDSSVALRLVGSMWVFWLVRGRIVEGWQMLEAALGLEAVPSSERIKPLAGCARLSWFGGDLNRTLECNREILTIAEMTGDAWGWALSALGFAAVGMFGSEDDAVPLRIEEVLPQFHVLGDDWETGMALQTLSGAAWHRGQYERAEKAAAKTAAIFRAIGHPTLMSSQRIHGLMLALLGEIDRGIAEVDKSMVNSYEANDLAGLAESLCCRGAIARYAGKHDLSRHYYRDALRAARDAGQVWMIQWALGGLSNTDQLGLNIPPSRLEACVQLIARAEVLGHETGITMAPRERDFRKRDLERARANLDEDAFEAAIERGRRLDLPEAMELALAIERRPVLVA